MMYQNINHHQCTNNCQRQTGMSLLELVLVIVIMSIIILPVSQFISTSFSVFSESKDNISALSKLRYVHDRLSKEIRMVNHNGTNFQITNWTNNQLTFVDLSGNSVDYVYNAPAKELTERYTIPIATGVLSDQVSTFSFNYYASDGTTTAATLADITFVEYSTTIDEGNASYSATGRVMLRDRQ